MIERKIEYGLFCDTCNKEQKIHPKYNQYKQVWFCDACKYLRLMTRKMIERKTSDEIEYALFNDRSLGNKLWLSEEGMKEYLRDWVGLTLDVPVHLDSDLTLNSLRNEMRILLKELEDKECDE